MIEIISHSLLSMVVACTIKLYLFSKHSPAKIKLSISYHPYKSYLPTTYFIIKSRFLTSEQMYHYLRDIRAHSDLANIVIIGKQINYEELFKNHYRIFGVIDTSDNPSLVFVLKQIYRHLDALYQLKK